MIQLPVNFQNFRPSGDANKDIAMLQKLLAQLEQFMVSNLPDGKNATFKTGDNPAKTATVNKGVITNIA
jgi:hypothetical protein